MQKVVGPIPRGTTALQTVCRLINWLSVCLCSQIQNLSAHHGLSSLSFLSFIPFQVTVSCLISVSQRRCEVFVVYRCCDSWIFRLFSATLKKTFLLLVRRHSSPSVFCCFGSLQGSQGFCKISVKNIKISRWLGWTWRVRLDRSSRKLVVKEKREWELAKSMKRVVPCRTADSWVQLGSEVMIGSSGGVRRNLKQQEDTHTCAHTHTCFRERRRARDPGFCHDSNFISVNVNTSSHIFNAGAFTVCVCVCVDWCTHIWQDSTWCSFFIFGGRFSFCQRMMR